MAEQSLLAVGSKAPAFSLQDESGKTVTLKELIGTSPIVLIFYPGDMTPGCTMQLCAVRDEWSDFQAAGIRVFGVNHADATSHTTFKEAYHFPFPLLIDTGKKVSAAYGAIKKFFKTTIIKRTVVGIDTNGTIIYYKHGMPKNTDILKAMQKYVAK
jgi:thioredoxin-dependent peroxiredoxin